MQGLFDDNNVKKNDFQKKHRFVEVAIVATWASLHHLKLEDMLSDGNCAYRMYCRLLEYSRKI